MDFGSLSNQATHLGRTPSKKISPFYFKIALFFNRNRWLFTWKGQLAIFAAIFLVSLVIATLFYFLDPHKYPPEMRKEPSDILNICDTQNIVYMIFANASLGVLFLLILTIMLWKVRDAFLLKIEFTLNLTVAAPLIVIWLISTLSFFPSYLSRYFWSQVALLVTMLISMLLPLVGSYYYDGILSKTTMEADNRRNSVRVVGIEIIDAVLSDRHLAPSFEEFCRETWTLESLLFYLHAKNYSTLKESQQEHHAKKLWQIYFRSG